MTPTTSTAWKYLSPNPKSAYKQLFINGGRIRARILFGWYAGPDPMTPDAIAQEFNLPVDAVLEAISYCESNPPELLEDYAREEALMEASGMNDPGYAQKPTPKPLSPQEIAQINRS
jgi:uncharacterized protein (DUF433 family)